MTKFGEVKIEKKIIDGINGFCYMIRKCETREQAEQIFDIVEDLCIKNNWRGLKGMWIMQQLNTAYEETFPWDEEDL